MRHAAVVKELTDVYHGLACHIEAVTRDAVRDKCLRRAEEHFTAASRLHQCTERSVHVFISTTVKDWITSYFAEYEAAHKVASRHTMENASERNALTHRNEAECLNKYKCIIYVRNAEENNHRHNVFKSLMSIVVREHLKYKETFITDVIFFRECPGSSPTVNASLFIAKAYLANLYYTQRRYEEMCEECNHRRF